MRHKPKCVGHSVFEKGVNEKLAQNDYAKMFSQKVE